MLTANRPTDVGRVLDALAMLPARPTVTDARDLAAVDVLLTGDPAAAPSGGNRRPLLLRLDVPVLARTTDAPVMYTTSAGVTSIEGLLAALASIGRMGARHAG
jgi:hypothetical protein